MAALREFSTTYAGIGLERPETRSNLAKNCHDTLEKALGKDKRTFFDRGQAAKDDVAEGPVWSRLGNERGGANLALSSLDFTVYAYIKEEMINTPESPEVKYLKSDCPSLMRFITLMDFLFKERKEVGSTRPEADENQEVS